MKWALFFQLTVIILYEKMNENWQPTIESEQKNWWDRMKWNKEEPRIKINEIRPLKKKIKQNERCKLQHNVCNQMWCSIDWVIFSVISLKILHHFFSLFCVCSFGLILCSVIVNENQELLNFDFDFSVFFSAALFIAVVITSWILFSIPNCILNTFILVAVKLWFLHENEMRHIRKIQKKEEITEANSKILCVKMASNIKQQQ